ncbi:LacI family DNA-binding transcriptional regulator [Paenarthrobacter nicotinovorans]|uniref:LacI family DNA-binding transcriptional regulator n=1 Tax=Paenarthrobacter nicotinovorans TaxID=29320 RepID=UPI0037FE8C10
MSVIDSNRPANITDVAARAGVSRAAVSKVIRNAYGVSPAMKERVETAIAELGYRPSVAARSLRGSSNTIGVELPRTGNPLFDQILDGAAETLEGTPYQLIVAPASSDHGAGFRAIDALIDRQVDGLLAIAPIGDSAWLEKIAQRVPTVMLGRHDAAKNYDTVTNDDVAGATAVMEHLFSLGHRHIAHVTVRPESTSPGSGSPHSMRLGVYERMLRASGGEPQILYSADDREQDFRDLVTSLLRSSHRPTAIFAGNDTIALAALGAIQDCDLTTADVSVVGYDGIELASHPAFSLTTVDQSGVTMGKQSMSLLLERLEGRVEAAHFQVTPELRIRRSTQPAKQQPQS